MSRRMSLLAGAWLFVGCQSVPVRDLSKAGPGDTFSPSGDYLIGRGDILGIQVHGDDNLTGSFAVDDKGQVSMPLVGFLPAAGMTIQEFKSRTEASLGPYVQSPKVTAWVSDRRSFRAYFCGEVGKVGPIQLSEPVSLLQGVAMAGGLTPFASGSLLVFRKDPKGRLERFSVSYDELTTGSSKYDGFRIGRGDTILAE